MTDPLVNEWYGRHLYGERVSEPMTEAEARELLSPPCQCSFLHAGYCDETCPNDREHDPWCSQAGRPVDRSRREANDRIAKALGLNAGIGEPFITDAIVRRVAAGGTDALALALAYVEANPGG